MNTEAQKALSTLTAKQLQVLVLSAKGMTVDEVAAAVCKSPFTIKTHMNAAYKRLGISKATQAAVICALAGAVTDWKNNQGRVLPV